MGTNHASPPVGLHETSTGLFRQSQEHAHARPNAPRRHSFHFSWPRSIPLCIVVRQAKHGHARRQSLTNPRARLVSGNNEVNSIREPAHPLEATVLAHTRRRPGCSGKAKSTPTRGPTHHDATRSTSRGLVASRYDRPSMGTPAGKAFPTPEHV